MDFFSDRRVILGGGGVIALALGLGAALFLAGKAPKASGPPPASQGGLVVEQGKDDATLDPARPLRCFVGGQMVGQMPWAECPKKNGVASRALDLGVDSTGALAAASDNGPVVQSLTASQAQELPSQAPPGA